MTTEEREAEGRAKGYSGVLMSDICRTEAKQKALSQTDTQQSLASSRGEDGSILEEEREEVASSKEEGLERWHRLMCWRFLRGDDHDFDYSAVDCNEAYDDLAEQQQDLEDAYYEEQSQSFDVDDDSLRNQTGIQDF